MKVKEEMNRLAKKLNKVKEKKSKRIEKIYDSKETMTEIVSDNEVNIRMNRKQHRRGKKRKNRCKRNQKKRKRRQRKLIKKREEWLKTLEKAHQVELPDKMYEPFNNTNYELSEVGKKVTSLGLKFVPTIRRSNTPSKYIDFLEFSRKLRLAVLFYHLKNNVVSQGVNENTGNENNHENQHQNQDHESHIDHDDDDDEKKPWTKASNFKPNPGQNEALEEYLFELENYLFNPNNLRKVKDNLTKEERNCLKTLSKWNKDPTCMRMFRGQDKGSRLVIESMEQYKEKC